MGAMLNQRLGHETQSLGRVGMGNGRLPGRPFAESLTVAKLGFISTITAGGVYTANLPAF